MQWITLIEHGASEPIQLTDRQVSQLSAPDIGLQIEAIDSHGACVIRTGSSVGVVCVEGLTLEIRPKIPLDRLRPSIIPSLSLPWIAGPVSDGR